MYYNPDMAESDIEFLRQAIENSKQSMQEGNFPAGAIVVKNDEVLSSGVSSPYPGLFHADSKAVTKAFEKYGILKDATLYIGLESCLMCTSVAYWSGIRRIVYAVSKSKVNSDYYETHEDTKELVAKFNEPIEFIHIPEVENEALEVIKQWEKEHGF
jgi:tRNA(adenine34) deaminase